MGRKHEGGVSYHIPAQDYFDQRELRRHAGVFYLWALGVAAVISGDFSGWNLGFSVGGWGGMFIGTLIIAIITGGMVLLGFSQGAADLSTGFLIIAVGIVDLLVQRTAAPSRSS